MPLFKNRQETFMAPKTTAKADDVKTIARPVIIVTAPGGPRRRAGYGFSPVETKFYEGDMPNADLEALIEEWRADPLLKIDTRIEEVAAPAEEQAAG
jgi:hypothetical protein